MAVEAVLKFGRGKNGRGPKTYKVIKCKVVLDRSYDKYSPTDFTRLYGVEVTVSPEYFDKFLQRWFSDRSSENVTLKISLPADGEKIEEQIIYLEDAICSAISESTEKSNYVEQFEVSTPKSQQFSLQRQLKLTIKAQHLSMTEKEEAEVQQNAAKPAKAKAVEKKPEDDAAKKNEEGLKKIKDEEARQKAEKKANDQKKLDEYDSAGCYYTLGDIIKHDSRYYICVSKHGLGGTAVFVSFCYWSDLKRSEYTSNPIKERMTGGADYFDTVFTEDMACAETVSLWIKNILMDDDMMETLRQRLPEDKDVAYVIGNHAFPQPKDKTKNSREKIVQNLFNSNKVVLDALKKCVDGRYRIFDMMYKYYKKAQYEVIKEKDKATGNVIEKRGDLKWLSDNIVKAAPTGYMLADKPVYSSPKMGYIDYYKPYIMCFYDDDEYQNVWKPLFNGQTVKEKASGQDFSDDSQVRCPETFKWEEILSFKYTGNELTSVGIVKDKTIHIVKLAMNWQHRKQVLPHQTGGETLDEPYYFMFDWNVDLRDYPDQKNNKKLADEAYYWVRKNMVSHELTFVDDGKTKQSGEKNNKKYESIWVKKEKEQN